VKLIYKEFNRTKEQKMNKSIITMKFSAVIGSMFLSMALMAGNEDRVGSAGASHLLVNPWSRSSALGDAGVASTRGLEATFTNIAGLAFTEGTQLKVNTANWMGNAGIKMYGAGFAQRVSDDAVIALSVQSMNFGDILITQVNLPEGGIGTFTPRLNVVNLGYARAFSSTIYAGINLKVVSESIANMRSSGVAIDAGIRYVTGEQDQIKFGITLKNVGPTLNHSGDGLGNQANLVSSGQVMTLQQRTRAYELPSLLGMGVSYDFILNDKSKLISSFAYTANSFFYDQSRIGLDYSMASEKVAFNIRGGFVYEKNIFSAENRANALVGPTAGFSVDALTGSNKSALGVEYCARFAGQFGIIHTFGLSIDLK
jgi:hypothetical protein